MKIATRREPLRQVHGCVFGVGTDGYVALTHEGVVKHFVQDLLTEEAELVWATQVPIAGRCFGDTISRSA